MEETRLIENQLAEMFDLGKYAFRSDDTEKIRERFKVLTEHSWNYGHFVNGKLASQLQATPFEVWLGEKTLKMAGIGTVSSYPEYRGQGGISNIMKKMLFDLNEAGVDLTFLAPFSYPFYRRYGYEYLFEKTVYDINGHDWPNFPKQVGRVKRLAFTEAKPYLKKIYEKSMAGSIGAIKREDWWYDYKFVMHSEKHFAVYFDDAGQAKGYVVYEFQGSQFEIAEWHYLSVEAFYALANYVGSHKDSFETIHYVTGQSDGNLNYLLASPLLKVEVLPEMMGRVVNVARFLESYPFKATVEDLNFQLKLTDDEYGSWNEGTYQVKISSLGECTVTSEHPQAELLTLSCDIQGFTQLMLSFQSPQELNFFEKINCPPELCEQLSQSLLNQKPVLEDYF